MVILVGFPSLCFAKKISLVLAAGPKKGVYFALAKGFKEAVEKNNPILEVIVLPTEGSVENAKLIDIDTADLALIQNDIAFYFSKGKKIFRSPSDKMKGVISLYTEAVHIIARKELNIKRTQDIIGKTVAVGLPGSGTEFHSVAILNALGITYADIEERFLGPEDTLDAIKEGAVDVAFFLSGIPSPAIEKIADKINFIPIEKDIIQKLKQSYPYFVQEVIPPGTYSGQHTEVQTCGVRVLLVASRTVDADIVRRVLNAILNEKKIIESAHPVASNIALKNSLVGITIPLHEGARRYYEDVNLIKSTKHSFTDYLSNVIFLVIFVISVSLSIICYKQLKQIMRKNIYIKLSLIFIILFTSGTIGMYFSERNVNEHFVNIGEAFWSSVVYLLSGFEDRAPVTLTGKMMSILIFAGSIFILGSVAGNFASIFIKEKEGKMPKDIEKHICICEWNNGGDKIIKEIHDQESEPDREIVVVTEKEVNEKELRKFKEYEKVYFIRNDPTLHSVLKATRVQDAKSVIVLADYESPDPDAKSALITLAIKKVCEDNSTKPYIIVQAVNHRKIDHIKDAGADEVVCATDFGLGIIAQSALYRRLVHAYQQLLEYSPTTNELYIVDDFPSQFIGKTFEEVAEILLKNRDHKNPAILVGVRRGDQIILNPKKDEEKFDRFEEGDALVVMAYRKPDLSKLKI